jgi:(4S)-4-hydroxy-5-phosphonooxypentane-2,3-dione isomerase
MLASLLIVEVSVHVKPDAVETFRAATLANARASVREPGIARFDFLQDRDDPTRFVLVEVYRTAEAPAAHKATAHYAAWRDAVAELMAEPRTSRKFVNVFPEDNQWGTLGGFPDPPATTPLGEAELRRRGGR